MPSQTEAYKLVLTTLNFRGGTKKSHPEQQARGALMGRPIKRHSQWSYPALCEAMHISATMLYL
jgi:hypothetical protein